MLYSVGGRCLWWGVMWTFLLSLFLAVSRLSSAVAGTDGLAGNEKGPVAAHWSLDGSLESAVGGRALRVEPAEAASFVPRAGDSRQVLALAPGSVVRVPLAFDQRAPGYQGRWAVVMDVRVAAPTKTTRKGVRATWSEVPLVQTDPANLDGAEMALSSSRGLEVASASAGTISPDGWHRVAMVVDEHEHTVTGFVDGVMTRKVKTTITDSRWALEPELLLFADKGRSHPGLELAGLQVKVGAQLAGLHAHIEAAGGPERPLASADSTALSWRRPPPSAIAAGVPFSVGFVASPPSGEVVLSYTPPDATPIVLSRAPADAPRMLAVLPAGAAHASPGTLELVWEGKEQQRLRAPLEVKPAGATPKVGESLLVNADLDAGPDGRLEPWRVSGKVTRNQGIVAGHDGDFALSQVVPLPPGLATGGFGLHATVRMKRGERASALGDRGLLAVRVKNAQGETLGAFESLGADLERFHERSVVGLIPVAAVELEVVFRAFERHGDKNSVALDRVDLVARPIEGRTPRLSKSPLVYAFGASELFAIFETDGLDVLPTLELVSDDGQLIATPAMTTTTVDERHFVHLAPLPASGEEGEPIRYRVRLGDELSETWSVEAPRTTGRLRMAWIADNQHGWQTFRTLVPRLRESEIDLLFVAGDFVQHGYKLREWQTEWFSPLSIDGFGQTTPIMMARGNHDANGALAHAYAPLPGNGHWHAFSRNGVRFIVLDTESDTDRTPAQLRWLADELASDASRYAELRVVTFHKPPFSNRWHSSKSTYDGERWVRLHLVPLFERYQVDLVVAGHAHAYQRRDLGGVRYVVVGGAGGALDRYKTGRWPMTVDYVGHHYAVMEVSDRRLSWVARDFEGQVIDSFELMSRTRHLGK